MTFKDTELNGVKIIEPRHFLDDRGSFVKTYHENSFKEAGIEGQFKEAFYSVSKKNVIRGMHFQLPPHEHGKLVYVMSGAICDVILDLRKESGTYGRYIKVDLTFDNKKIIYIPPGLAHGFLSLEEGTVVVYLQTTVHNPEADCGIRWDSFGLKWDVVKPVISKRDRGFASLNDFSSPF